MKKDTVRAAMKTPPTPVEGFQTGEQVRSCVILADPYGNHSHTKTRAKNLMMRKRTSTERVWDSMKSCAAAKGISTDVIRSLKERGSKAFRGSRIYERELDASLKQLINEKPTSRRGLSLRDEKLSEEIRRLKLQNDEEAGRLIPIAYVQSCHNAIGSRVASILRQKLEIEYPNAAAGLDVRGARVYGKRLFDQIMIEFQKLGAVFET